MADTAPPRPETDLALLDDIRDEDGVVRPDFLAAVQAALSEANAPRLRELVGDLHEADQGAVLEALDAQSRPRLITLLGADFDFTALTEIDDAVREEILEELEPGAVAEGVRDLDADDAVAILEDLDEADKAEILDQLPAFERLQLQKSLDYPEESAGRRMQTDFIAVPPFWTVGEVIDYMRETVDLPERFYEIYVVEPSYRLRGAVALDTLLRTKRPVSIADLVDEDRHRVQALDDQVEVARLFERYNLVAVPVVDAGERLVGLITVDDILDVVEEEADAEVKALGGVKAEEELSDTVIATAKSRFTWLFVNLLTAVLASAVIGMFEASLQQMVALAILMPIVASQGGNAGTQTMTVAVRALATRDLTSRNVWRVVKREALVGLINGVAFAVIMALVALVWFRDANLGFVIALAMVVTLVAAAIGGILIPLILDKFEVDPAVASGPFVTTVTDVVGFFSFLGIATWWYAFT
jgi:magnesium transporter